jgi:hypothetical protein
MYHDYPEDEAREYAEEQAYGLFHTLLQLRKRKLKKQDVNPDLMQRIISALHALFVTKNVTAKMYTQPEKLAEMLVDITLKTQY